MPTVEIDGQKVEVEDGLTVIQAADKLGVEIPHYCWHPGLSIAGNCRMCLVEIEKSPKLQIACNTRVTDGMVVHTKSERTQTAQKAVLEFLLINHPIDCPICDQAGECKLQEYYMDYDRQPSRFPLPEKNIKGKALPIGPHVMLDQERCILCARCTRFLDEVTHTSELGIHERGDHCEIELAPGKTLDNPYSVNVVDICPVGALTSREFRFKARVWYLERTPSLCAGCATGCNIEVYQREGRMYRFQPRANLDVNQYWMCDAGRMTCRDLQAEGRLTAPMVRGTDAFEPGQWEPTLDDVAARLQAIREAHGQGSVGVVVSARA
jgi:NADH-quinone oxidoreductase subunit G